MNEEITTDIVAKPIDDKINKLVYDIMSEEDPSKTKDLVELFNWNMSKKNIVRIEKLNKLYDSITDQMTERVTKRADQFSNSDLLDYVKTIQGAIDVNKKNLENVQDPPLIVQQNNTSINVNVLDSFDRDAKARILAAVQATINQAKNPVFTTDDYTENTSDNSDVH